MSDIPKPHLPHVGKNKELFVIGGVAVVAFTVIAIRRRSTPTPAAATDNNAATDPTATDGSVPYDNGYGSYSAASGVTPSLYGYQDPTTGSFIGLGSNQGTAGGIITAPTNNAQWAQMTTAYLTEQGYNPVTVTAALGKYLAGLGLSDSQLAIVQAAIGVEGNPPQAVPPPHHTPPSGQPKPIPVPKNGLTAPHVWISKNDPKRGLATISWNAVPGATEYHIRLNGVFIGITKNTAREVPKKVGNYAVLAYNGTHHSPPSNRVNPK